MIMDVEPPKISVITTSYTMDRFKDIKELIDSIQAQSYKNIEVIFVAERSREMMEKIRYYTREKAYTNCLILYNEGSWGVSAARNLGIKQANGDIVAFIDDDAFLLPGWAEETAKTYIQDSSIIGITGPILPKWDRDSMAWFPREFYWIFSCTYWDWVEKTEVRNGYGTNVSFRREAFDLCGLFNVSLGVKGYSKGGWQGPGAEETEFSLRVRRKTGKRIVYSPEVKVKHKVYEYRFNTKFIAKRAYWEGSAKAMLSKLYRSSDKAVLSTEYELLHRILTHLLPGILRILLRKPLVALRQLWVTVMVLSCVTAGYLGYKVSTISASKIALSS